MNQLSISRQTWIKVKSPTNWTNLCDIQEHYYFSHSYKWVDSLALACTDAVDNIVKMRIFERFYEQFWQILYYINKFDAP